MSDRTGATRALAVVVVVIAAAAAIWYLRARPHGQPAAAPGASATGTRAAGASGWVRAAKPPSVPAPAAGQAPPQGTSPQAMAPPAASDAVVPEDVEKRQDAKIGRGLASAIAGNGILVVDTPPGSPAAELRLERGDLITSVNGHPVTTAEDFVRIFRSEGMPTQLTIQREGRERHLH